MAKKRYGMIDAWAELSRAPLTCKEVSKQLGALDYLERKFDPDGYERRRFYDAKGPSKRRARLLKMFWAYKRMEA